jgi:hypothetical protein
MKAAKTAHSYRTTNEWMNAAKSKKGSESISELMKAIGVLRADS